MSDLISRSGLIEAIKCQYCTGCDNYNGSRCRACHADDMLALVDDAVDAMPRWISVEERLPEQGMVVLVRWHGEMAFARYTPHRLGWYNLDTRYDSPNAVSHWMPLPPMPKEE